VDGLRDHPVDEAVAFGLKRRPRRRDVFINQPAYDNLILSLVVTITAERRFGGKGRKKAARWASERSGASTQAALNSAPRRESARGPLFLNERVSIKSIIRYPGLGCESIPFNYLRLHFARSLPSVCVSEIRVKGDDNAPRKLFEGVSRFARTEDIIRGSNAIQIGGFED